MTHAPGLLLRTRMTGRDPEEHNRTSTPLELLFDLTFVVAIAQIVLELAHDIADGHAVEGLIPYLMVFFAIWWAWMNFTWFASAYDNDDVLYRVFTMLQMAGVLVLAAGVPSAFNGSNFAAITIGYAIMRLVLVAQWIRAAVESPQGRPLAIRYAVGITAVQVLWLLRLLLPADAGVPSFAALVVLELAVPLWAARKVEPNWHPHHIAERYGLFVIILLGESVLAATNGVQGALDNSGVSAGLVVVSVSGLALLFALWWLYFLEPAGAGLERRRDLSYFWGYGHFGVFASLAAVGSGLEVAVESMGHHVEASALSIGYAVALPTAIFLVLLWGLHAPLVPTLVIRPVALLPASALILVLPLAAPIVGVPAFLTAVALVCATLIAVTIADVRMRLRADGVTTG